MSNKKEAELHRQLADKLDEIAALEMRVETEKQIRETTEEQLRIADTQLAVYKNQAEEKASQSESFRLMAIEWREKALTRVDLLSVVDRVFSGYTNQDFSDLEAKMLEAKGLITSEEFDTMEEYDEEIGFMDNLICLVEEVGVIKGEFFDASEGEEDEGLKEF